MEYTSRTTEAFSGNFLLVTGWIHVCTRVAADSFTPVFGQRRLVVLALGIPRPLAGLCPALVRRATSTVLRFSLSRSLLLSIYRYSLYTSTSVHVSHSLAQMRKKISRIGDAANMSSLVQKYKY